MRSHENFPDLVDKPKGHFFIETEGELFFCLVMKKHRMNLRQMNQAGLLSEDNKRTVVEKLADFVANNLYSNYDFKEILKLCRKIRDSDSDFRPSFKFLKAREHFD